MNKQMIKIEPRERPTKVRKAQTNYMEIKERKAAIAMVAANLIKLGKLFKTCRDGRYYRALGYNTFASFLRSPEINFNYKTAYSFIKIYELYILKLKLNPELLILIGHAKLQAINTVVEKDPRRWLAEAKKNNKDDLINKVRIAQKISRDRHVIIKKSTLPQEQTFGRTKKD